MPNTIEIDYHHINTRTNKKRFPTTPYQNFIEFLKNNAKKDCVINVKIALFANLSTLFIRIDPKINVSSMFEVLCFCVYFKYKARIHCHIMHAEREKNVILFTFFPSLCALCMCCDCFANMCGFCHCPIGLENVKHGSLL